MLIIMKYSLIIFFNNLEPLEQKDTGNGKTYK